MCQNNVEYYYAIGLENVVERERKYIHDWYFK